MKVTGNATLRAPPARVFEALQDPGVLVRTIPGCEQLEEVGTDAYRMTITAGVASIKGTYLGDVRLTDQDPPGSFVLRAQGAGTPGTVHADVLVRLSEAGEGTRLEYDADAIVGGMLGGVGQRVLAGVAKKTAGEFFAAVDDVLTGVVAEPSPATAGAPGQPMPGPEAVAPGVFTRPAVTPPSGSSDFVRGAVVGAGIALLGVLVGGWLAGRRR